MRLRFSTYLTTVQSCFLMFIGLAFMLPNCCHAEGSKDFVGYPGYRMFLDTRDPQQLKVYANEGETINVGASHVGIQNGFIRVFNPDGLLVATFNNTGASTGLGIINNYVQEANGPTGGGATNGLGYIPGTITVPQGQFGIWTVVFDYPSYEISSFNNIPNNFPWTRAVNQPNNQRVVLAWDITVSQNGAGNQGGNLLEGRVFSNEHISLMSQNGVTTSPTFYVLTNDGYIYQADFHEIDPFRFPISSNSLGLVDGDRKPIYKSKPESDFQRSDKPAEWISDSLYLYEPQAKDDGVLVNNKLFFNPPNPDLPASANTFDVYRNSTNATWLLKPLELITVDSLYLIGEPGSGNPCSFGSIESGNPASFIFETNLGGVAYLELDLNNNGSFTDSVDLHLMAAINAGIDEVVWDGKDGLGNPIPIQDGFTFNYRGAVKFGELHIAFTDVENAPGGVTFKWLNAPSGYPDDLFYYDNSDIGGMVSGGGTPGNALPTNQPYTYSNNAGNDKYVDHWFLIQLQIPPTPMTVDVVIDCFGGTTETEVVQFGNGFDRPVDVAHCGDDRLFVAEQKGMIWILDADGNKLPSPFLDLQSLVGAQGEEQGLLGLAFHPNYAVNGFFYVNYILPDSSTRIARFTVSASDPNVADPASELALMNIDQPFANNNGGSLKFGPDGYLYIAMGDGGGEGDPLRNAQNLNSLLGKLLRIDVDNSSLYFIPTNNPFAGTADAKGEVWAYGLRNPRRFSFDAATGDLWLGDMGQGRWEEIDRQPASSTGGENYGWRCYEASEDYSVAGCDAASSMVFPHFEYPNFHTIGCGIVGGYVYRGCGAPALYGTYIFTDRCSGRIWGMASNGQVRELAHFPDSHFSALGENSAGELFLLGNNDGIVYKITSTASTLTATAESCAAANDGQIQFNIPTDELSGITWEDGSTAFTRTNLAPGLYTMTATTATGCEFSQTIEVAVGSGPSALPMLGATDVVCAGAKDGQAFFVIPTDQFAAFAWSDSSTVADQNDLAPGTYTVTVTMPNGCEFSETVEIGEGSGPSATPMLSATAESCAQAADGQANFIIPTSQFATFLWSDGSTEANRNDLPAGTHQVTVTMPNGCEFSETVTITAGGPAVPGILLYQDSLISTDAVAAQYQWFFNGSPVAGATENDFVATENGVYSVQITDTEGCTAMSATVTVTLNSSIESLGFQSVVLSPNPFEGDLNLDVKTSGNKDFTIRIMDASGKLYLEKQCRSNGHFAQGFGLAQLPAGTYLFSILTNEGEWSQQLIKQ